MDGGGRGETDPGTFVGLSVVDAHMGWQLDLAIILIKLGVIYEEAVRRLGGERELREAVSRGSVKIQAPLETKPTIFSP